jgi:exopolyphosphatase/guanosine-5'-triphosphate,3'-diphosphate pyrophosphatase
MKQAAIDIGTNSMRLLIASVEDRQMTEKSKWLFPTRMGEGLSLTGSIPPYVLERNLDALMQAKKLCDDHDVKDIYAFGTSALRDAHNGSVFIQEAAARTGIHVEIITGDVESRLAYLGVMASMQLEDALVLDVGGGSSEWVLIRSGLRHRSGSVNVGAVRMKEAFLRQDPPAASEQAKLQRHVEQAFSQAWKGLDLQGLTVVGIGGTATSISAMNQRMEIYQTDKIHNSIVTMSEMEYLLKVLCQRSLEQRRTLPGLQATRADVIIPGLMIVMTALRLAFATEVTVSDWDNLEGAIYHKINQNIELEKC